MAFERKTSLFSLALSEILIINLWFTDIGRLQASNLSLLKIVLELNLQLFGGNEYALALPIFLFSLFLSHLLLSPSLSKYIYTYFYMYMIYLSLLPLLCFSL